MGDVNFAEIKSAIDGIHRTFSAFKEANDLRLEKLEKQGTAGADREEKVNRIGENLDKLLDKVKALETANNRPDMGTELDGKAEGQAKQIARKAFEKYLRRGEKAVSAEDMKAIEAAYPEFKGLATDSDPSGGLFLSPERSSMINAKIFESSPIRQIATVETISTDVWEEINDYDEADAEWVGERSSRSTTGTPEVSLNRIQVHEMQASPAATQKMLDDASINVEAWLSGKVQEKFARKEATAFVSGDGVLSPKGFLSYSHGDGFGFVERVASGTSATFDADDLISIQDTLLEAFQPGASWVMRRATRTFCRQLKDGQGQYLWSVDKGVNGGVQESILGKPVVLAADMPAMGANALAVAYGDFRQGYVVVDRIGIRVLRDPYTSKPNVIFYTTKRVGGGVRNFQAIKLLRLAASTT